MAMLNADRAALFTIINATGRFLNACLRDRDHDGYGRLVSWPRREEYQAGIGLMRFSVEKANQAHYLSMDFQISSYCYGRRRWRLYTASHMTRTECLLYPYNQQIIPFASTMHKPRPWAYGPDRKTRLTSCYTAISSAKSHMSIMTGKRSTTFRLAGSTKYHGSERQEHRAFEYSLDEFSAYVLRTTKDDYDGGKLEHCCHWVATSTPNLNLSKLKDLDSDELKTFFDRAAKIALDANDPWR